MTKYLIFTLILTALLLNGCGSVSVPSGSYNPESRTIDVTAIDGVIRNARVRLASLLRGGLSPYAITDENGKATLTVTLQEIERLANDDMVYLYVESTNDSSVMVGQVNQSELPLKSGQVKMKSYLGNASKFKVKAAIHESLNEDAEIGRRVVVSHLSNAVSMMVDAELKRDGQIARIATPNEGAKIYSAETLRTLEERRLLLLQAQTDRNSPISQKLHLISIATKALVEQGISDFLDDGVITSLSSGAEAILDLAVNTELGLSDTFSTKVAELDALVEEDIRSNPVIRSGLDDPSAVLEVVDFISVKDIVEATAISQQTLVSLTPEDLTSSSLYKSSDVLIDLQNKFRGGGFTGSSISPAVGGNFIYNP